MSVVDSSNKATAGKDAGNTMNPAENGVVLPSTPVRSATVTKNTSSKKGKDTDHTNEGSKKPRCAAKPERKLGRRLWKKRAESLTRTGSSTKTQRLLGFAMGAFALHQVDKNWRTPKLPQLPPASQEAKKVKSAPNSSSIHRRRSTPLANTLMGVFSQTSGRACNAQTDVCSSVGNSPPLAFESSNGRISGIIPTLESAMVPSLHYQSKKTDSNALDLLSCSEKGTLQAWTKPLQASLQSGKTSTPSSAPSPRPIRVRPRRIRQASKEVIDLPKRGISATRRILASTHHRIRSSPSRRSTPKQAPPSSSSWLQLAPKVEHENHDAAKIQFKNVKQKAGKARKFLFGLLKDATMNQHYLPTKNMT